MQEFPSTSLLERDLGAHMDEKQAFPVGMLELRLDEVYRQLGGLGSERG